MATAPLRKCMSVVAGTPGIDSPYALVITSRPPTLTLTMAARRCWLAMTSFTTLSTVAAEAGATDIDVDADGGERGS
jgi:hypothetical protein